jgi:hypothetical protein
MFLDLIPEISEKIRLGLGMTAAMVMVGLEETVGLMSTGTSDLTDIPAGFVGALYQIGVRTLIRYPLYRREVKATSQNK